MISNEESLLDVLQEMEALLTANGEKRWRNWIVRSRDKLVNSDSSGIELLLSAYGGMASFNDLVLDKSDDDCKLQGLRSKAWELANVIRLERNANQP